MIFPHIPNIWGTRSLQIAQHLTYGPAGPTAGSRVQGGVSQVAKDIAGSVVPFCEKSHESYLGSEHVHYIPLSYSNVWNIPII